MTTEEREQLSALLANMTDDQKADWERQDLAGTIAAVSHLPITVEQTGRKRRRTQPMSKIRVSMARLYSKSLTSLLRLNRRNADSTSASRVKSPLYNWRFTP